MTYPPGHSVEFADGNLGLLVGLTALPLIVGVTSGGVANTLYQYSDVNALRSEHVGGPAVELAAPIVEDVGAVMLLKTTAGTAGSNGAVTKAAVGSSTGTITVAGTPNDSYRWLVELVATGTLGAAQFRYSLDRDTNETAYTWSEVLTVPSGGTYVVPGTGITLTFVPGDGPVFFEAGDLHRLDSTAPLYTTTNLSDAFTALLQQLGTRDVKQVFLAGKHASGADAATMAAALASNMNALESEGYYARAIMDAGEDTAANVRTAMGAFAHARVGVAFGNANISSRNAFSGWGTPRVPAMNAVAERAARAQISENLGRRQSGTLRGVVAITHDERVNQQFGEADKVMTLRSQKGRPGFVITNGYLKSPFGSDFLYYDYGRVVDVAATTADQVLDRWVLAKLRALSDGTGRLEPKDAVRVQDAVNAAIKAQLKDPKNIEGFNGHVSEAGYTPDLSNDYLGTRELLGALAIVPLPPAENIRTVIGLARSL